jgi:hypothetical protein
MLNSLIYSKMVNAPISKGVLRDKLEGCFVGGAIGEAIGTLSEQFAPVTGQFAPHELLTRKPTPSLNRLPSGQKTEIAFLSANLVSESTQVDATKLSDLLQERIRELVQSDPSIEWSPSLIDFLRGKNEKPLKSASGITRTIFTGLLNPSLAVPLCAATHKHPKALDAAETVAVLVSVASRFGKLPEVTEIPETYKNIFTDSVELSQIKNLIGNIEFYQKEFIR